MKHRGIALLALAAIAASAPAGSPSWEIVVEGRVIDAQGRPMRDVLVYAYHADDHGNYTRGGEGKPRLSGMLRANVLGGFRVRTVLPGLAEGIPHIHFELAAPRAQYRAVAVSLC